MKQNVSLIGYASSIAANIKGSEQAPEILSKSDLCNYLSKAGILASWDTMVEPDPIFAQEIGHKKYKYLDCIVDLCTRLAVKTKQLAKEKKPFVVLGGDHSSAIGTWSGVKSALDTSENLGLIWIDAHLDAHTPETTETGNLHGMPLAVLLGYGPKALTQMMTPYPKLLPQQVCMIGPRSYEEGEANLIQKLGVRVYKMDEIQQRGLEVIMREAIQHVSKNTHALGLSIDIDAIDPHFAPAVSTAEPFGIESQALLNALKAIKSHTQFLWTEIVEFNPLYDQNHQTEQLIFELLAAIL